MSSTRRHAYTRSATTSVSQLLADNDVVRTCTSLIQKLTTRVRGPSVASGLTTTNPSLVSNSAVAAVAISGLGTERARLESKYADLLERSRGAKAAAAAAAAATNSKSINSQSSVSSPPPSNNVKRESFVLSDKAYPYVSAPRKESSSSSYRSARDTYSKAEPTATRTSNSRDKTPYRMLEYTKPVPTAPSGKYQYRTRQRSAASLQTSASAAAIFSSASSNANSKRSSPPSATFTTSKRNSPSSSSTIFSSSTKRNSPPPSAIFSSSKRNSPPSLSLVNNNNSTSNAITKRRQYATSRQNQSEQVDSVALNRSKLVLSNYEDHLNGSKIPEKIAKTKFSDIATESNRKTYFSKTFDDSKTKDLLGSSLTDGYNSQKSELPRNTFKNLSTSKSCHNFGTTLGNKSFSTSNKVDCAVDTRDSSTLERDDDHLTPNAQNAKRNKDLDALLLKYSMIDDAYSGKVNLSNCNNSLTNSNYTSKYNVAPPLHPPNRYHPNHHPVHVPSSSSLIKSSTRSALPFEPQPFTTFKPSTSTSRLSGITSGLRAYRVSLHFIFIYYILR
jgi:hypothetical protein